MIRRLIGWFVLIPFCVLLVGFALANRHAVAIGFGPLFAEASVPMFIVIYAMLILGIFMGGIAAWFAQGSERREKRRWRREAERLQREREAAQKALPPRDGLIDAHDL